MLNALFALSLAFHGAQADLIRSTISQWFWLASVPVGDYLYISGGETYDVVDGTVTMNYQNDTLIVDLTTSWSNQTLVAANVTAQPDDMRTVRQPVLFYDKGRNVIRRYGGWPYVGTDMPSELWEFPAGTTAAEWTEDTSPSANGLSAGSPGPFAPAAAFTDSTLYSFGGNVFAPDALPNMTVLSGLVTQDLSSGTWSNATADVPNQNVYRTQAKAVFVPNFGDQGFFVVVGGESPPTEASFYEEGDFMVDMSVITLYDVASGEWFTQTATGNIPPPRSEFCAVGAASSGGESFELFVFGGSTNSTFDLNHSDDEGYLNVYTLSLPGFEWFQSPSRTPVRRASHTCSVVGKRQMISVGGRLPSTIQTFGAEKDPWVSGIGVFDMTAFTWSDIYDAAAGAYESPQVVKDYYASSYKEPTWSDDKLASVFAFTASPSNNSSATSTASGSGSRSTDTASGSSVSSSGNKSNVGPIVGGVVGGIGGVAILLGLGYWIGRRRRAQRQPTENVNDFNGVPNYYGPTAKAEPNTVVHEAPISKPRQELDTSPTAQHGTHFAELPANTGGRI